MARPPRKTPTALLALLALLTLLAWTAPPARAELPLPLQSGCADANDDGQPDDRAHCPNDFGETWNYISYIPARYRAQVRPEERALGSGGHIDRAWQRTTGDWRVIIAVLDSGIRWGSGDLVNKFYLNAGELPEPQNAAGQSTPGVHDLNGDTIFNIRDYAEDPRVSDRNGNGMRDPQDLILDPQFANGVDDDANGYVDDISGWDFLWDDNDAFDDTNFGHGTGEAHDSVAEANNGSGTPGGCPNCAVLMVRAGDSFVVDVNNWAEGIIFAVDSGARVLQYAVGSINMTTLAYQALDYAWAKGVASIASAADETSQHHNYPGTARHTTYVHAIRYDTEDRERATTFLNYSNCTNYGGQLALSAPATGCSSGATGWLSGVAGLVLSAALQAGVTLSGAEIHQILIMSVDDIDIPESLPGHPRYDGSKYPSRPGWDHHFGYGRPNARKAVDMVLDGRIPPEVDLLEPDWFNFLALDRPAEITGRIAAPRAGSFRYVIEWAAGVDPADTRPVDAQVWHEIRSGESDAPLQGVLASFDPATVPRELLDPDAPLAPLTREDDNVTKSDKVNIYSLTLRVRVTDDRGNPAEARRMVYLHRDPDLTPGFPLKLRGSFESSPKMADLDGDGVLELVLAGADGMVLAVDGHGAALPGWPVYTQQGAAVRHPGSAAFTHGPDGVAGSGDELDARARSSILATVAIGDLQGDGSRPEVVAVTLDGAAYVWDATGLLLPGWPQQIGWLDVQLSRRLQGSDTNRRSGVEIGAFSSPALGDLDDDGDLEIVFGGMD
ncbi:MAG: hypothetical protein FJ125_03635, partial [Deltaproteobacteria bacterium]|nr:hypothetical protein [Deltaproteobacteria bacterium]